MGHVTFEPYAQDSNCWIALLLAALLNGLVADGSASGLSRYGTFNVAHVSASGWNDAHGWNDVAHVGYESVCILHEHQSGR